MVVVTTVVLLSALIVYALFFESLPNKAERRFIASIQTHLEEPGDWKLVSDIHPGDWTEVCLIQPMSTGGGQNLASIKATFQIDSEAVNLPNGIASSSDWSWVVMFFYPPNTVEAFELPTAPLVGQGVAFIKGASAICRNRKEAVFQATETDFGKYYYSGRDFRAGGSQPIKKEKRNAKTERGVALTTLQQVQQGNKNDR